MEFLHLIDGLEAFNYGIVRVEDFFGNAPLIVLRSQRGTVVAGGLVDAPMISSIEWKLSKSRRRTTVTPMVLTKRPSRTSLEPTIH